MDQEELVLVEPSQGARTYRKEILSEDGYQLIFSNQGLIPKKNVCPEIVNPKTENGDGRKSITTINCIVPGCHNASRRESGYCKQHGDDLHHVVDWVGVIEPQQKVPDFNWIIEAALKWARGETDRSGNRGFKYLLDSDLPPDAANRIHILDDFVDKVVQEAMGNVPDATTLQRVWEGQVTGALRGLANPDDLAEVITNLVDAHFPIEEFGDEYVDVVFKGATSQVTIPIRIVMGVLAVAFICEEINRGTQYWAGRFNKKVSQLGCLKTFLGAYLPLRGTNLSLRTIIQASRM